MFALSVFVGTYFCGSLEKLQKLEPTKISCHTVGPFNKLSVTFYGSWNKGSEIMP